MGEHTNQSKPNPGLRADGTPCRFCLVHLNLWLLFSPALMPSCESPPPRLHGSFQRLGRIGPRGCLRSRCRGSGGNCIKTGLHGKSIFRDYFQENMTSRTKNQFSGKTYFYTIRPRTSLSLRYRLKVTSPSAAAFSVPRSIAGSAMVKVVSAKFLWEEKPTGRDRPKPKFSLSAENEYSTPSKYSVSAETEYSVKYWIFCKLQNIKHKNAEYSANYRIFLQNCYLPNKANVQLFGLGRIFGWIFCRIFRQK